MFVNIGNIFSIVIIMEFQVRRITDDSVIFAIPITKKIIFI